ncbi:MAG: methionine gamma-lyase family protein [Firmicutes bacterium]|nr:methionine gamma-lyase family protein [Bacillota bacterium]
MDKNEYISNSFGICDEVLSLVDAAEEEIRPQFAAIDERAQINQMKVMKAFADNRVSDAHFAETTGYGYDDLGRDTLDKVYADIFGAEDALVRHSFVNGTHTISTALFAVLRPGDTLMPVTGKPYDTLEEVIGISGNAGNGSLKDFGVKYAQVDLKPDGGADFAAIEENVKKYKPRAVMIQRSKGYDSRPTLSVDEIGDIIAAVKAANPDTICMVDNCYGEFVDDKEPTEVGADLVMGSLIKNPGGGLAPSGGYIVGRADLIELCAYRFTSVGIGKECGASLGFNRAMYQGLFFAPHVVAQAVKTAVLCAAVFERLRYAVEPSSKAARHDIIQAIRFESEDKLTAFCQGIQKGAPIDSFVTPEAWDMPGYQDKVIMAAGAFIQGASIELSADGPIRPPYTAFMQGGLTYESARLGIAAAAQRVYDIDNGKRRGI